MSKTVNVIVERNSFVVTVDKEMISLVRDFAQRFNSFAYMYDKRKRRRIAILDKRFYVVNHSGLRDKTTYRFTRESLMDFAVYCKLRGLDIQDKRDFNMIPREFKDIPDIELSIKANFILRDYQEKYVRAVIDNKMPKALIELQVGRGKTLIACAIAAEKKKKICLLLPGYIDKWEKDILNTFEIEEKEICTLQGNVSIKKVLDKIHKNEKMNYKVFIVSAATLMIYSKAEEDYGPDLYIPVDKLFEKLEIGTIMVDEIHEKFFATFYLNLYLNPELLIGMTATFTSGNAYMKKFQDVMFPPVTRLNFVKIKKYIHTFAVAYEMENNRQIHCKLQNMYNHDTYESSTIIASRDRLQNFLKMIEFYFKLAYLDKYKTGDKVIIFVASVRFATMIVNFFSNEYPKFNTKRYTSDDSYDNLMEADIIVSTLQSAGTAVDIPKLRVVLNTVVTTSEIRNKQSHGRLREIEDTEVLYYYFYCNDIDKHKEFHKSRVEHLRPYSKELNFIKYNTAI